MLSLIVEDDSSSHLVLQKVMREYGEVHGATNGTDAVEMFRDAREKGIYYDLVCLDILLPGMSGQDVLTAIREAEEIDFVPTKVSKVVMITAMDDKSNVLKAFRDQCDAYLVKPVEIRMLREQLATFGFKPLAH